MAASGHRLLPYLDAARRCSLGITEGTVRSHLEDIYARLQVSNRAAAVARAFPAGVPMQ